MASTDPTLDTLMSDPLILSLMKADRVDPERLRAKLTRIGDDIARRRKGQRDGSAVRECLHAHFASARSPWPALPAGGLW